MEVLSLALRPKRLSQMVGQGALVAALRKQMTTRPARALLFHGGTGCGKTTLARIVGVSLQCTHQEKWGDPCDACWSKFDEFTIHEHNAAHVSGIDELKTVAESAKFRPMPPSRQRVIILDEAQRISSAAQNMLLKPTEEPPSTTTWIICTTDPQKLLPTLRRRFLDYTVKGLSFEARDKLIKRAALRTGYKKSTDALIEAFNEQHISSPALMLMAFEKFAGGMSAKEAVVGAEVTVDTLRICKAVSNGEWKTLRGLLKEAQPEEARYIRASVIGWLRGWLWREESTKKQIALANSLMDLSDGRAPLDDATLMPWLVGTLYQVCSRFQRREGY